MSAKADSRLAEFLRRIVAGDNDAAPADLVFGPGTTNDVQVGIAKQFAASVRELGYISSTAGSPGDLDRVEVTAAGREWLADYDGREKTLHPRFTS